MLARTKNVLVVAGNAPYKSIDDLLKAGKTKSLSYASVGNGASSHIIGEFISRKYSLNAVHVPYKGGTPAITDLMGGQVDFMAATYGTVASLAKDGRVRILAVSDDKRDPRIPNVPTFEEAGLPSLGLDTTIGLYGPANLPKAIVEKWSDALGQMAKMPDVEKTLENAGFDVWYKPAGEMAEYHRQEVPRLGRDHQGSERPDELAPDRDGAASPRHGVSRQRQDAGVALVARSGARRYRRRDQRAWRGRACD